MNDNSLSTSLSEVSKSDRATFTELTSIEVHICSKLKRPCPSSNVGVIHPRQRYMEWIVLEGWPYIWPARNDNLKQLGRVQVCRITVIELSGDDRQGECSNNHVQIAAITDLICSVMSELSVIILCSSEWRISQWWKFCAVVIQASSISMQAFVRFLQSENKMRKLERWR